MVSAVEEALDGGDYAICLDCWDMYVVKNATIANNPQLTDAATRIEFTYNLICATHPFR
jgi:hypothetical protein